MPYIPTVLREDLDPPQPALDVPANGGQLNYVFTREIVRFLEVRRAIAGRISYEDYNTVIGALEACKLELYRRLTAPHEDIAIAKNGDVYHP